MSAHTVFGDRATGRSSFQEQRFNVPSGQRQLTRMGSGMTIALSRFAHRVTHRPENAARPPGRPSVGLGSPERYIANRVTEYAAGSESSGERVWWYLPDQLLHGDRAPVVVYLHGFRAAIPDLYSEHIHHLTRQGVIVIFPRYNKASLRGMLNDNDQNAMFRRSSQGVRGALAELGQVVDHGAIYAFGHSLGGLFAACWPGAGGIPIHGMVLAHPSLTLDRVPEWARKRITRMDYEALVKKVDVPVWILNGDADTIAPMDESEQLFQMLTRAPEKRLFLARSDQHGSPRFQVGHLATVRDDSHVLHELLENVGGGTASDDTLHYRYYYAALDAMIHGQEPCFDMGCWSDGVPVAKVEVIAQKVPSPHEGGRAGVASPAG